MSTGIDARRRPDIWSYISFGSSSAPRRRSSSLPTRSALNLNIRDHDPYEKPERWNARVPSENTSILETLQANWMAQTQRSRFLKTGGIVAVIIFVIYLLSPGQTPQAGGYVGGKSTLHCAVVIL